MSLHLVPVTRDEAFAFIAAIHRHHMPPQGFRIALGARDDNRLVGVAVAGRPVARHLDDKTTAEVTRVAVIEGVPHACSMLYAACWRAVQALGYTRVVTYTQAGESGASLRAAGWELVADLDARPGWDMPSRRRAITGTEGVARTRWEKVARRGHGPRPQLVLPPAVEDALRGSGQLDLFAEVGAA